MSAGGTPRPSSGKKVLSMIRTLVLGLSLTATVVQAAPLAAPRVHAASFDALRQPLPLPYDGNASADAKVAAARARALKAHKRLLIDLGGNWCLDCRLLAGVMDLPEMRAFVARHFEVVTVDVGRFDQNMTLPARYGFKGKLAGVPAILIVDPRSGRLVNVGRESALADARAMTPQAVADWLAQWAA